MLALKTRLIVAEDDADQEEILLVFRLKNKPDFEINDPVARIDWDEVDMSRAHEERKKRQ